MKLEYRACVKDKDMYHSHDIQDMTRVQIIRGFRTTFIRGCPLTFYLLSRSRKSQEIVMLQLPPC